MTIGVLLINVGTPDGTDITSIRRYLSEFMSDYRVIDRKGLWWRFLLNRVIIPKRAPVTAAAYRAIWNHDRDESPLRTITRNQAEQVQAALSGDHDIRVGWAMRYGSPAIADTLHEMTGAGCDRLLIVPLYPQYAGATTGTVLDKVDEALREEARQPALHVLPPYYATPAYVATLADTIRTHHAALTWQPQTTILSFHGLPQHFIDQGDPYQSQCEATADLLRNTLNADASAMPLAYQSRGGRAVWIGPGLEETLTRLAADGIKDVSVVTPGFAADCVETLEEVAIRAREHFIAAGGRNFTTVPCLNDSPVSVGMLTALIREELSALPVR